MRTWAAAALVMLAAVAPATAGTYTDPPLLAKRVTAGDLPPLDRRLPGTPAVADLKGPGLSPGHHGGTLNMLMGRSKDTRIMVVYGYARLVGYDRHLDLVPDILEAVEVEDQKVFTLKLRKGHKWSDGHPFTAEDFRYYWEDVVMNKDISPGGVPRELLAKGEPPRFEVVDETTVRYTWPHRNPGFLPLLAGARPLYIYRPAHYMKQFHARYAAAEELAAEAEAEHQRNWVALHYRKSHQYKNNNPDLPTLQPWMLVTPPPSDRFVFERNPYFHRVDSKGQQLPYIDRVVFTIASARLIPAKAGAGESDLQARHLSLNNVTFLKQAEARSDFQVRLWKTARGAHLALYPNLNTTDAEWRRMFREPDFRRALSLAIDRTEINQVMYFGLATEGNNTVQAESPLFRPEYRTQWATFDLKKANALLDKLGLKARNDEGVRLLPDGRPMELIVETAGEDAEQADVLGLVRDTWIKAGIKLHTKPLQREVFRNRVFAGSTLMSLWVGLENGVPTANTSPHELTPTSQQQLQWPKWGQYFETKGTAGAAVDLDTARELKRLYAAWHDAAQRSEREAIWRDILKINAEQAFTIGLVSGVRQPVVVDRALRNVPEEGIYNWDPGAHFGMYRPDTFWFADPERRQARSGGHRIPVSDR